MLWNSKQIESWSKFAEISNFTSPEIIQNISYEAGEKQNNDEQLEQARRVKDNQRESKKTLFLENRWNIYVVLFKTMQIVSISIIFSQKY